MRANKCVRVCVCVRFFFLKKFCSFEALVYNIFFFQNFSLKKQNLHTTPLVIKLFIILYVCRLTLLKNGCVYTLYFEQKHYSLGWRFSPFFLLFYTTTAHLYFSCKTLVLVFTHL